MQEKGVARFDVLQEVRCGVLCCSLPSFVCSPVLEAHPHRIGQIGDSAAFKLIEVYRTPEALEAHKVVRPTGPSVQPDHSSPAAQAELNSDDAGVSTRQCAGDGSFRCLARSHGRFHRRKERCHVRFPGDL